MFSLRTTLCLLMGTLSLGSLFAIAFPDHPQWQAVEEAMEKGLPKTAISRLEPIIDRARREGATAEAIRAVCLKISLEAEIQGNKPEERITRMHDAIDSASEEMRPVMEAILAHWYWQYYQQNRWRFMQRTETETLATDDTLSPTNLAARGGGEGTIDSAARLTTWSLPRIFEEIDQHFQRALAGEAELKATPIESYDALLEKGTAPDEYRPTLYDFLTHDAISFYTAGEQAGARPQNAFHLDAESPVFADVETFVAWRPVTTDEDAPLLKAVRLYQSLLQFHRDDANPAARFDANLERLRFAYQATVGETKNDRYLAALKRFHARAADHPISTRILYHWASVLWQNDEFVESREIAQRAVARFPESAGAESCRELIEQIEAPSLMINTEKVWNRSKEAPPILDVDYKNIRQVHFRLVQFNFDVFLESGVPDVRYYYQDRQRHQRLLRRPAVRSWTVQLPTTEDFQERTESLEVPEGVSPGSYLLLASEDETFRDQNRQLAVTDVWVSELAVLTRNAHDQMDVEAVVLDNESGEPISKAQVTAYRFDRRRNGGRYQVAGSGQTDAKGIFRLNNGNQMQLFFHVRHGDQVLVSSMLWHGGQERMERTVEQTQFFTDRALYRPGQTIHYKGVSVSASHAQDRYETISGRDLTIIFADANGEEIERRRHRTNDYGTFSGSVVAPTDRLAGQMSIRVEGQPHGQTTVRVEAYKRPKFRVALDPPDDPPRLDDNVQLSGKATAYTGVAIGNAKVNWRVVREVRFPIWWHWRYLWPSPRQEESQEIANGITETAPDGSFELAFVTKPDPQVDASSQPTFRYTVYAEVTDTTGETRSADKTITVGYTALQATLSAKQMADEEDVPDADRSRNTAGSNRIRPRPDESPDQSFLTDEAGIELTIRTETLDGEGQSAQGDLRIYRVEQPDIVQREPLGGPIRLPRPVDRGDGGNATLEADPRSWPLGEMVVERQVETDSAGTASEPFDLEAGYYRAKWETRDRFGNAVTAVLPLRVLDPDANHLALKVPQLVAVRQASVEPGETFEFIWGSGYEAAQAFIEIVHRGKVIQQFWTEAGKTQRRVRQEVDESMRGGFTVRVSMVRENRAYVFSQRIDVPWTNKQLNIRWERFTSKLQPGTKERWTAVITGPKAERAAAEMVAALYDASLDAFLTHDWADQFNVFRSDHSHLRTTFGNEFQTLHLIAARGFYADRPLLTYRHYPARIVQPSGRVMTRGGMMGGMGGVAGADMMQLEAAPAEAEGMAMQRAPAAAFAASKQADGEPQTDQPDLSSIAPRTNLAETAFFFPHLTADDDGEVRMEFTMPEALTEWRFLGFAHDRQLRSGKLDDTTVTAKDLMVEPNPPRFVRTGDRLEMTVKVSNQSPTRQTGNVRLAFQDARTNDNIDALLQNTERDRSFDLAAGASKSFSWRIDVPDDLSVVIYKAVGSTGRLSDGEEGYLPVLSKQVMVTESMGLPIRGAEVKTFDFQRLKALAADPSVKHHGLTVEMTSNPSWYAVMALPYLMEYPHQCSEQVFNRLYANALARKIATADPAIERMFKQWRELPAPTDPLVSPLAKNEELKSVLLEETPWVREAKSESQSRRNVGILFDDNRLNSEIENVSQQLSQMQRTDGAWPWFPGGRSDDFITLYITTGFARLQHLGVDIDTTPARRALPRLDRWIDQRYLDIDEAKRNENHLSPTIALYLYGRSFFIDEVPIDPQHHGAFDYWVGQAKEHWLDLRSRMSQAHLAIALKRFGDRVTPAEIMASIEERSVHDDELGRYWRDTEQSWWWYRAEIETQAVMIEAFDEVSNDADVVEQCKVWLLKQKQTQAWKSTKATADAVYALLLRGEDGLHDTAQVEVRLGDRRIEPDTVEAGTGMFRERIDGEQVVPQMSQVTVRKETPGIAWGGLHWQYFQDIDKLTAHEDTPLQVAKEVFVRKNTAEGPKLFNIEGPLEVGDELVVRLIVQTDRAMEYVHLKDERGSGTEPLNVLSGYRTEDGLALYESTRDTASHFFIDYLPKGTYVLEYESHVQLRGEYETGIATLQCMYAPEFNSHSASVKLRVESGEWRVEGEG